jgi:uncharacterized protein YjgD (DUF1641 family)
MAKKDKRIKGCPNVTCPEFQAKAKYEAEKETLAELIKLRNEMRKEELMDAVIKSDRSYAEIMAFIKGEAEAE